ncbi:MAG: hypothetical protein F4Z35_02865 [Dehalococcoidia bacterium]|nr:hypothetical protein [Dehalococcoidia bacterium]
MTVESAVMISFTADYCIAVFISSIGVLQFAFSLGGLRGLLFFNSALVARSLGLATAILGFALFFGTGPRNINDYEGGLDAPDQALFFSLSALAAFATTLIVSSLVNRRMRGAEFDVDAGLDALRESNYASALVRSLMYWCSNWRTLTKRYFSG